MNIGEARIFVPRILQIFKRRNVAAKLGSAFKRSASFQQPQRMNINGQLQDLYLPNESGVKVAFIDLLLDDSATDAGSLQDPLSPLKQSWILVQMWVFLGSLQGMPFLLHRSTHMSPTPILNSILQFRQNLQISGILWRPWG